VKQEAATRQDLDDASSSVKANEAAVNAKGATAEAYRAQLRSAALNLEYATIRAPIGGRIGDSSIQVGGLISAASQTPLTTIVPLDPIWVRFKVQEVLLPQFQKATQLPTGLILSDGTTHPYPGVIVNTLNQVLDARRNLFSGELTLARLREEELSSVVQLYRALGGGWQRSP
jgi:membrane fusion protein (multidrug efflux system)